MKILLDECLPEDLKYDITDHEVAAVAGIGWAGMKNGQLLALADQSFDAFLTADRNIEYQQNLRNRHILLIVLICPDTKLETLRPLMPGFHETLQTAKPGTVSHVEE